MARVLLALMLFLAGRAAAQTNTNSNPPAPPTNVVVSPPRQAETLSFTWNYPNWAISTNLYFIILETTNVGVPLSNWVIVTNVCVTNLATNIFTANGLSAILTLQIGIKPGQYFFQCIASNAFWSANPSNNMSQTSNIIWTPPPPVPFTFYGYRP
jgi:hypothetical protein